MTLITTIAATAIGLAIMAQPSTALDAAGGAPVQYELGVDVSGVAATPVAVDKFLSKLTPEMQRYVILRCGYYMVYPDTAAPATLTFCEIAVGV